MTSAVGTTDVGFGGSPVRCAGNSLPVWKYVIGGGPSGIGTSATDELVESSDDAKNQSTSLSGDFNRQRTTVICVHSRIILSPWSLKVSSTSVPTSQWPTSMV